jgi:hypothetical protein
VGAATVGPFLVGAMGFAASLAAGGLLILRSGVFTRWIASVALLGALAFFVAFFTLLAGSSKTASSATAFPRLPRADDLVDRYQHCDIARRGDDRPSVACNSGRLLRGPVRADGRTVAQSSRRMRRRYHLALRISSPVEGEPWLTYRLRISCSSSATVGVRR